MDGVLFELSGVETSWNDQTSAVFEDMAQAAFEAASAAAQIGAATTLDEVTTTQTAVQEDRVETIQQAPGGGSVAGLTLPEGVCETSFSLSATAADSIGSQSVATTATVDVPPSEEEMQPEMDPIGPDLLQAAETALDTLTITGRGFAGSVVTVTLRGATVAANDTWSTVLPVAQIGDGQFTVRASATDGATPLGQPVTADAATGAWSATLDVSGGQTGPLSPSVTTRDAAGTPEPPRPASVSISKPPIPCCSRSRT